MAVQINPKLVGECRFRLGDGGWAASETVVEPLGDQGEPRFDVEPIGRDEAVMETADRGAECLVLKGRGIHRGTDEVERKKPTVEIEVAFAEPAETFRRVAVVGDAGWEDGDGLADGAMVAGVKVVADGTVVDDQYGPGVVAVRRAMLETCG
jgi:hypothetical protein